MTPTLESTRTAAWALAALVASACAHPHPSSRSTAMTDQNKRDVANLFETCFNLGDLGLLDRLVSPDYVGVQGAKGPAGVRGAVTWHWTGTHTAAFRTYPATGKAMTNTGAGIFRFKDGKIVAAALETDRLGF